MQPFDILGLPGPDECLGMAGLLVSVLAAIVALIWLGVFQGGVSAFGLLAIGVLLGISSFIYCVIWGQSPENSVEPS
jgi:hypothetical protein